MNASLMKTSRPWLFALLLFVQAIPGFAAALAFVSVSAPDNRAVRIVDIDTMTVVGSISNVGDEPSRMVSNAAGTRIWLSSFRQVSGAPNEGLVYLIDTQTHSVLDMAIVGSRQNRSIALSPDETRIYTLIQETVDGITSIGVAELDANNLDLLRVAPIEGPSCLQFARAVGAAPNGTLVMTGCADGLRVIDPVTLAVSTSAILPITSSPILGFAPDGAEVYVPSGVAPNPGANTGITAIHLASGASNPVVWAGGVGGVTFPSNASVSRMTIVQRPSDPPGDPLYYFSYFSASSGTPVAWARASDLRQDRPGGVLRQLIGAVPTSQASVASAIGATQGTDGLGVRLGGMQRLTFEPAIASVGSVVALAGVGTLSDVLFGPAPIAVLHADGFEE